MEMKRNLPALLSAAALSAQTSSNAQSGFDLAVYSGTAGGVITAVRAARMGLEVARRRPLRRLARPLESGSLSVRQNQVGAPVQARGVLVEALFLADLRKGQ